MMRDFVEIAAHTAEIAGVLVIIGGMIFAAAPYAFMRASDGLARYKRCGHDLGRAILLGLEISGRGGHHQHGDAHADARKRGGARNHRADTDLPQLEPRARARRALALAAQRGREGLELIRL
jgi:hypothetical protein